MRRTLILCLFLLITASCSPRDPTKTPVYSYQTLSEHFHDPDAFTQGLAYANGILYESTGIVGASTLRRTDLNTGHSAIIDFDSTVFGEGLAIVDDQVFVLTWKSHKYYIYDQASLSHIRTAEYPYQGWGLTYDGTHLIASDGSDTLRFLDVATMQTVRTVTVRDGNERVDKINELEYVEDEIWANIWHSDRIARISPASGHVVGWIDLAGLLGPADCAQRIDVLNGIAYDSQSGRVFVTGKLWCKLFEIKVDPQPATLPPLEVGGFYQLMARQGASLRQQLARCPRDYAVAVPFGTVEPGLDVVRFSSSRRRGKNL